MYPIVGADVSRHRFQGLMMTMILLYDDDDDDDTIV